MRCQCPLRHDEDAVIPISASGIVALLLAFPVNVVADVNAVSTAPRRLRLASYGVPLLRFIVAYPFVVSHCLLYPFDVDAAIQAVANC